MKIEIEHDKKADALYLYFSDKQAIHSKELDRERIVDYTEEGEIRRIKFLSVSSGVSTDDLPHRSAIESALTDKGFIKLTGNTGNNRFMAGLHRDARNPEKALPEARMKAGIVALMQTSLAILIFVGFATASVLLARNLFVLSSLPALLASLFGLVVTLAPTVLGFFILFAWVLYARSQARRPSVD